MVTSLVELTNFPVSTCHVNELNHQKNLPDFSVTQETLAKLLEGGGNTEDSSVQHGILQQVASVLETSLDKGIPGDASDLNRRHKVFGRNIMEYYDPNHKPCESTKGLFYSLSLESYYNDPTVVLLLCCATLSLVIGIKRNGPEEGFRDGAMLFLAIFIVVNFGATLKFIKARTSRMSNKHSRRNASNIAVMRGGIVQHIPVTQIVIGDVVCLEMGGHAPADGLLIIHDHHHQGLNVTECNSIFWGTKVEGDCRMLVTSVGRNTERGRLISSINSSTSTNHDNENSRLNGVIEKTNSRLEQIMLRLSLLILMVQLVRCFGWEAKYCDGENDPDPKGFKGTVEEMMNETTKLMLLKKRQGGRGNYKATNGLVAMLCILILALRDGVPLGIFILLAFASKKIKSFHQLVMVHKLEACATLGLVTTICASPIGDLNLDCTKMTSLWIGVGGTLKEVDQLVEVGECHPEFLDLLREGICMNLCGEEEALLWWANEALGFDCAEINQSRTILFRETSDSKMDRFGLSVIRRKGDNSSGYVHLKGRPEMVLSTCSHCYDDAIDGTVKTLDDKKRAALNEVIATISSDSLDCLGLAYKKIVLEEIEENNTFELEESTLYQETVNPKELQSLIFVGLVALKNPYSPEVRKATKRCHELGVKIRLVVTNGDIRKGRFMANLILEDNLILNDDVIEASEFRNSSKEERKSMAEKVLVMVNCTPMDKLLFVQCLREKGEVVAGAVNSIRGSPILSEVDVGFFIGSEPDKANADMVMSDLNLVTICAAIEFGRCVHRNLVKFLLLQLTFSIVAFTVNFGVVLITSTEVPFSAFQLLWVNMIMFVLGALALVTSMFSDHRTSQSLSQIPIVMTKNVWRSFVIQFLYQVSILLTLYIKGKDILHVEKPVLKAMVFNSYVVCMVFALINARKGHEAPKRGRYLWWFIAILGCMLILQVGVAEIAAVVGWAGKLSVEKWCICIGVGSVSFLIDSAVKLVFKDL